VNTASSRSSPPHCALEQAAEWFALLLSGQASAADRRNWQAWLSAADEHGQAWNQVEALSRRFAPLKSAAQPQLAISAYQQAQDAMGRRRRALLGIAALGGVGMLAWRRWPYASVPAMAQAWLADYRTGTGDVRQVTLPDGTRVWLNAVSAFDQDYRQNYRLLKLIEGDILIDTARDPQQRPFHVQTAQGRLHALGTRFAVRRDGAAQTILAVYEGAVGVRLANGVTGEVLASQQVRFTADGISDAQPADPAREAWTQGLLIARNQPLAEVIAQLRRHYRGYLGLASELADLRVFGSYPMGAPEQALTMLAAILPIRVRRVMPGWIVIESGKSSARQKSQHAKNL